MELVRTDFDSKVLHARRLLREGRDIPTGLVADEVQRSWSRSLEYGLREHDRILFDPVSAAQQRRLDDAHRVLLDHATPELQRLFAALDDAHWVIACLEASGTIIKSLGGQNPALRDIANVLRPGLNLSENLIGTNAPGCALEERRPVIVRGSEHFLEEVHMCACVAVPIFDPSGDMAGVLNASRHHHAPSIGILEPLALTARAIENRMVNALPGALRLRLHYSAELVDTPMCGLLALSHDGRLLGANPLARQLLELDMLPGAEQCAQTVFQCGLGPLLDMLRKHGRTPAPLHCHNGVLLHVSLAEAPRPGTIAVPSPRPAAAGRATSTPHTARASMPSMLADPKLSLRIHQAERAFARGIPVLINGETGTGKEVLARHLHDGGPRASGPFVAINCSAIPSGLIESELFGYDDGAFTGARRGGMAGRFEHANGGTLFLDEIGDMPLELQARLLRVLQERTLTRLGSPRSIALDCSVICATHRDLAQRVASGEFREDLYYRINGLRITLPALRERSDLDALIDHFLAREAAPATLALTPAARDCLHRHDWPGNIRELQQVLRLGAALAESSIDLVHLPAELTETPATPRPAHEPDPLLDGKATLQQTEAEAVRAAFLRHDGNISATARTLGIARATLYRKLRGHGLLSDAEEAC
ncbi:sigma-54-dependent Fis family transcriptional regulator [Thauera sp. SDU_THAU2]|uniref:sigma-54-dependent Fis family transcriptional regulator n=1 Tax=Thauera sp. SDU_THAU2 TaxID=3136633 RepID=UPI00311E0BD1